MKHELHETEIVEVVLRKEMSMADYKRIYPESVKKGWNVQAYQLGVFSEGTQTKIKEQ